MPQIRSRNLTDLLILFRNYGVGKRFIQHSWGDKPNTYWTITKVDLRRIDHRVNRATVYGILTKDGVDEPEQRIRSLNKREWAFIPDASRLAPWEARRSRFLPGQESTTQQQLERINQEYQQRLQLIRDLGKAERLQSESNRVDQA